MKQHWQRVAARIDEMALRQRAMLFATMSLVVIVFVHVALIEPLLLRQKTLIERSTRDQSQLVAVRAQIEGLLKEEGGEGSESKDPDVLAVKELEGRLAEMEKALAERKGAFAAPNRLPEMLRNLLGPGRPLTLEALRTLPATRVQDGTSLYRHGLELTLRGSYVDLTQYLTDLEKMPARLLWGTVELQVEQYPDVRLTLQVHTLTTQRSLGL
jgi:MSHA biogenesis protein MshJ